MNQNDIEIINLNNYVLPDISPQFGKKWTLNGEQNSFFKYIKERFNGSPTNAGIIKAYSKYIYGNGLADLKGNNIHKFISKQDVKLICESYKIYGQFTLQVIWSQGSKLLKQEPQPIQFKYMNTAKIGLSLNTIGEVDGYFYSYDWENTSKYKPKFYPKFDGIYKENPIEVITFSRTSDEDYFANPDYLSGLQWAHIEEEMSNSAINHILNGFSAGKIINCRGGVPATEELRQEYRNKILSKLTGSNNTNKVIVSFSNGLDSGTDIDIKNIEVSQLDTQLVYFSEEAMRKIFAAHEVVSPILFGDRSGSGLGSNSGEMIEALKIMYRQSINPMREDILDSLQFLFKHTDVPNVELAFDDFEELKISKNNELE